MKSFILAALLFAAVPLRAQITLEHTYPNVHSVLVPVDSAEWKYVIPVYVHDSIQIYNLDHSLDHVVSVHIPKARIYGLYVIAKHLFSTDGRYDFFLSVFDSSTRPPTLAYRLLHEDGTLLWGCDSCDLGFNTNGYDVSQQPPSNIVQTKDGAKMTIIHYLDDIGNVNTQVYSLPGRLPGSSQMLNVNPNLQASWPQLESVAYPNPSQGRVRIAYDLPSGVTSGEIVLSASDGREVKRYHITNAFNDLLIEESDLPSGSYFYKVVTERGESAAQWIVREK